MPNLYDTIVTQELISSLVQAQIAIGNLLPSVQDDQLRKIIRAPNFLVKPHELSETEAEAEVIETLGDWILTYELGRTFVQAKPGIRSGLLTVRDTLTPVLPYFDHDCRNYDTASPTIERLPAWLKPIVWRLKSQPQYLLDAEGPKRWQIYLRCEWELYVKKTERLRSDAGVRLSVWLYWRQCTRMWCDYIRIILGSTD